ncbi:MAG: hypothetical protein ACFFB5_24635 [Promethearchaeota archaeon]
MKSHTFIISISVVVVLFSLGTERLPDYPALSHPTMISTLNEEITLKFNESRTIDDILLTITFTGVLEEARCPTDVQCFWEGFVTVQVSIRFHYTSLKFYNLTSGLKASMQWINITLDPFTYSIHLIAVNPQPISTHQTPQSDYNITLTLTENPLANSPVPTSPALTSRGTPHTTSLSSTHSSILPTPSNILPFLQILELGVTLFFIATLVAIIRRY